MFQTVFPVLPLLIICHAWMTIVFVETLGREEGAALPPECYPA
ncbi:hypothetical protein [Ancylobacter mangrovi]|uniref:Uncharacterized protein n=1 Tax=Ancylobacter mangrovi TaxID=2972472 RepID=A0A9X2PGV7_9HYPH|nr:hypothetical protein [Ancylobacter mangrovi]MCS0497650.1 hypothetical protein [Ancylobacter mangrovi]MCS0503960.1 hypothetical protein [Ancylobacter mangrovi]